MAVVRSIFFSFGWVEEGGGRRWWERGREWDGRGGRERDLLGTGGGVRRERWLRLLLLLGCWT